MQNYIKINILKYPVLKKCECCDRVRDIYYNTEIKDHENEEFIIGNLNLCKQCGDNLNKIMGNEMNLGDKLIKEFTFD